MGIWIGGLGWCWAVQRVFFLITLMSFWAKPKGHKKVKTKGIKREKDIICLLLALQLRPGQNGI